MIVLCSSGTKARQFDLARVGRALAGVVTLQPSPQPQRLCAHVGFHARIEIGRAPQDFDADHEFLQALPPVGQRFLDEERHQGLKEAKRLWAY